ncbi:hypothetical protein DSO57_1026779 [Entomophthora muscae]|uniref:Uncharacterized protein n=1 Tax=Entomophthora muscae TaxID=34485 RepID=A0ACC2SEY1_9FUNG|nr:hypothetical protein DSO57_1026779 [Entomophthora muscae]
MCKGHQNCISSQPVGPSQGVSGSGTGGFQPTSAATGGFGSSATGFGGSGQAYGSSSNSNDSGNRGFQPTSAATGGSVSSATGFGSSGQVYGSSSNGNNSGNKGFQPTSSAATGGFGSAPPEATGFGACIAQNNTCQDAKGSEKNKEKRSISNNQKSAFPSPTQDMFDPKARLVFEFSAAYHRLANLRFGDMIPMTIYHSFLLKFAKSLDAFLLDELRLLDEDDRILKILVDDPVIVTGRQECLDRLDRLWEIRRLLL